MSFYHYRRNPPQPLRPSPSQQLHHHRLRLIIQRMRGSNRIHIQPPQSRIPQLPRSFLQPLTLRRLPSRRIHLKHRQRNPHPLTKPPHKRLIPISLIPTQPMVYMRRRQHNPQSLTPLIRFNKPQQQRHRVRPTGHRHTNPLPRPHQRPVQPQTQYFPCHPSIISHPSSPPIFLICHSVAQRRNLLLALAFLVVIPEGNLRLLLLLLF